MDSNPSAIPAFEPGILERRRHKRLVSRLKVSFREIKEALPAAADPADLHSRFLASAPLAKGEWEKDMLPASTEDLSKGGFKLVGDLQLLADRELKQGTHLLVELEAPEKSLYVRALGTVAWSGKQSDQGRFAAGISFTAMGEEEAEELEKYLADCEREGKD